MTDFNLIPSSYQQRLARQRMVRLAGVSAGVLAGVGLAAYLAIAQWADQVRDEVAVLEKQQAISARQRDTIAALNADQRELEQQWRLLESLRSGMPAKAMMEKVQGALLGKDVWFLDWRLRRAGIVTKKEPAANQPGYFIIVKQQGNPEDWRSGTHMTIKGQAVDHSRLSEFAQRLLSQPDIQDVRVQRTSQSFGRDRQPVAVDFDLAIVFQTDPGNQLMQELLDRFDSRQLKLMAGCAVFLLLAAVVSYGFWPKIQELRALQDSRAVLTQVTSTQRGAEGEIASLKENIEGLRRRLQGDMANLPMRQMESFIIGRLQTISWRNGVTLVGVEPTAGNPVEMYHEVLFQVELTGDYFSLLDWLGDVSSELGFVVIKEFQLGVARADEQNPKLTTRLLLAAYRVMDS